MAKTYRDALRRPGRQADESEANFVARRGEVRRDAIVHGVDVRVFVGLSVCANSRCDDPFHSHERHGRKYNWLDPAILGITPGGKGPDGRSEDNKYSVVPPALMNAPAGARHAASEPALKLAPPPAPVSASHCILRSLCHHNFVDMRYASIGNPAEPQLRM